MMASENCAAAKEPDVVSALGSLESQLQLQAEWVGKLGCRLIPVLSASAPNDAKAGPGRLGACSISGGIFDAAGRIGETNAFLRDLLDRLEI